ncbi:MAG TPA: orotidine-5'-phosphate decarboxylase [Candidatus Limnocylindria bacterium]|nr:orotidine-5'-phosphate decarboxylase [Candidatus Limnocylindria bacterium]
MSSHPSAVAEPTGSSGQVSYLDRLTARISAVGTTLCLGVDPDPDSLPAGFSRDIAGVERFAELLLEAALPRAAAVKFNLAFYEAFGSAGVAALERLRAQVPRDVPFIADAKRADVASTAARQAVAIFDALGADAVTLNPYLGGEALEPFLSRRDRYGYVLCRTSNPGAAEFQGLNVGGQPLFLAVAQRVAGWAAGGAPVGLVVGATAPAELAQVRAEAPGLPFLVPGLGAQGGDAGAVLAAGPVTAGAATQTRGGALLVNVSRGIASAADGSTDAHAALSAATERWASMLRC